MKRISLTSLVFVAVAGLLASAAWSPAAAWEPKEQGECIAPANPGGGWDSICRTAASSLQKTGLMKTTMYVTNMPGGSGAVAIANVITKRQGDPNLLVACSNSLTFTMALKRSPHTWSDVIPLAQLYTEHGGFFVKQDSKYKNLGDLVNALKADPKSVTFAGGSAPGSLDHIKAALFAKTIGVDPTKVVYVPFQGGGEALTSLLGGHTEVAPLDLSEVSAQLEAGKLRCLGLLSEKRSAKFKDIPTAAEQGVKISFPVWRGVYMAPSVPADAVKYWSESLQKMAASPEYLAELDKLGAEPMYMSPEEFTKFVKGEQIRFQELLTELGFLK